MDIDWTRIVTHLISVTVAYVLALPRWLGSREKSQKRWSADVSSGGCSELRLHAGCDEYPGQWGGQCFSNNSRPDHWYRIYRRRRHPQDRGSVHGTATAASIWNTGAIGAATAFGRYEIAIVLSAINFATLRLLTPLKQSVK